MIWSSSRPLRLSSRRWVLCWGSFGILDWFNPAWTRRISRRSWPGCGAVGRLMMLGATLMLLAAGCATRTTAIDLSCVAFRVIKASRADKLTPGTERQIRAHNQVWRRLCPASSTSINKTHLLRSHRAMPIPSSLRASSIHLGRFPAFRLHWTMGLT